jgi:hypothetical protein
MNKVKVHIDWDYTIKPSSSDQWENSSIEECDLIISVNNIKKINSDKRKVLWLYEPRAIIPDIYDIVSRRNLSYTAIFSHCENLNSLNKIVLIQPFFPSWIEKNNQLIYEKTKNISMIASKKVMCSGHSYRQEIAEKIPKHFDLFGHGRERSIDNKIEGLRDYRFSIAMENSCSNTYYTEKILDCFLTGCIPIYWGTRRIMDIFNPNGVIMLKDFMNNIDGFDFEKEYDKRKDAVLENFNKAKLLNLGSEDGISEIVKNVSAILN